MLDLHKISLMKFLKFRAYFNYKKKTFIENMLVGKIQIIFF